MTIKKFLFAIATLVWFSASAQTIRLIVPFSPGGTADRCARVIEKTLSAKLPYSFTVEYQTGAAGIIAANSVAKNNNKETVLLVHSAAIATNVFNPVATYDLDQDFIPIAKLGAVPMVLVSNSKSNLKDLRQLRHSPESLFYATSGLGSASHIAGELLQTAINKELTPVFYKGESAAFNDILSNNVSMMFVAASIVSEYSNSSQVTMLGITGTQRNYDLPRVPTFNEQGIRQFDRSPNWIVLLASTGSDTQVLSKIRSALVESFAASQDQELYKRAGIDPSRRPTVGVREFLLEEVERLRPFKTKLDKK